MALINEALLDITDDVTLADSKPKIIANFDDLLANEVALDTRAVSLENGHFNGNATWNDFYVAGIALTSGIIAPDLVTFQDGIKLYGFNGVNRIEETHGSFEIMHDYKEGTDIRPHIHWSPINANAGDVKWQLEYTVAGFNGTFPANTIISSVAGATGAKKHIANEFDVIDGANLKVGDVILFRLFRDATDVEDTYGSDAFLLSLGIHYQVDSTGSDDVFTKS